MAKNKKVIFSKNSDEWETPISLFEYLNYEFNFNLDPCCTLINRKCDFFFTKEDNGLIQDWGGYRVFCNPPYSNISNWVKKCYFESLKPNTLVCLLIPSRTDTKYFHEYIYNRSEIRFIKGRLRFSNAGNAPFPSMLVIFRSGGYNEENYI